MSNSNNGNNSNNSANSNNTSSNSNNNTSQNSGIGLQNLSYADFIVLSSVLSYAISEELDNIDLDLFIVFLGIVQSDLATLRIQKGIRNNGGVTAVIDTVDAAVKDTSIQVSRQSNVRKVKKIKKKKIRKSKNTNKEN